MAKIQLLRMFLNQRLTAAAEEIFGAVEKTIAEYQEEVYRSKEENGRLQRQLDIVLKPQEIQRTGLSLAIIFFLLTLILCDIGNIYFITFEHETHVLLKDTFCIMLHTCKWNYGLMSVFTFLFNPSPQTSSSSLSLSSKRRFPLSSNTVSRNGAPVWGKKTQSPLRLRRNNRSNIGPVRRKSFIMTSS